MKWGIFGFFPVIDPIHQIAQKADSKALLNELKLLYLNGQLKAKINSFYEDREVVHTTPLCLVLNQKLEHSLTCVRHLLSFGASPSLNERFIVSGEIANAPIHEAARKDNIEAMAMLILAGADIHQPGTCGIQAQTLLQKRGHTEKEFSLLTRIDSVQKVLAEGKKFIESAKKIQQDRIERTVVAYETLITKWQNCKYDEFLSQFSGEGKNCLTAFIEDKTTLLRYELYEFITNQFYDPASLSDELNDKLKDLLSSILEYDKIDQLPVPKEHLAAHFATLIIKSEVHPSKQGKVCSDSNLSLEEDIAYTLHSSNYLHRRNPSQKLQPDTLESIENDGYHKSNNSGYTFSQKL